MSCSGTSGGGGCGDSGAVGDGGSCALPEGGLGVDIGEEGTGDLGEHGVEIGAGGLRDGAVVRFHLEDGEAGDGRLGDRPEDRVGLIGGGEALRGGCEAVEHARREGEIERERKARRGAEERARGGIEDGRIDQAGRRGKGVARDAQVCFRGEDSQGERAERLG